MKATKHTDVLWMEAAEGMCNDFLNDCVISFHLKTKI